MKILNAVLNGSRSNRLLHDIGQTGILRDGGSDSPVNLNKRERAAPNALGALMLFIQRVMTAVAEVRVGALALVQ